MLPLLICVWFLIICVSDVFGNMCMPIEEPKVYPENQGKQLFNHVFNSSVTNSLQVCGKKCLLWRRCKSVNFAVDLKVCKLNKESHLTAPASDFIDVATSSHYIIDQFSQELLGKCANHDCDEGSICTPNPPGARTRYVCVKNSQLGTIEGAPICNETTNIDGGIIMLSLPDMDGDGYYDNNMDCTWNFAVTSGRIKITPKAFALEKNDWVLIYGVAVHYGPFSGTALLPEMTSDGNSISVFFSTDSSTTRDKGFTFTVENIDF